MQATISHVSTCFPDYFSGSRHDTIAVPVDGRATIGDVLEALEFHDDCDWSEEQWSAFNSELLALRAEHDLTSVFDQTLEIDDGDDGWSVYAYFTVEFWQC